MLFYLEALYVFDKISFLPLSITKKTMLTGLERVKQIKRILSFKTKNQLTAKSLETYFLSFPRPSQWQSKHQSATL